MLDPCIISLGRDSARAFTLFCPLLAKPVFRMLADAAEVAWRDGSCGGGEVNSESAKRPVNNTVGKCDTICPKGTSCGNYHYSFSQRLSVLRFTRPSGHLTRRTVPFYRRRARDVAGLHCKLGPISLIDATNAETRFRRDDQPARIIGGFHPFVSRRTMSCGLQTPPSTGQYVSHAVPLCMTSKRCSTPAAKS